MQASELDNIVKKFPSISKNFVGVFSINTIPKFIKKNHFFICNTEPNTEPGQHWFTILKTEAKKFEYFDSLGVTSEKVETFKSIKLFRPHSLIKYNETPFQMSTSLSCGLFVLYFIVQRMHNLDLGFSTFLDEIFETDCEKNENLVKIFAEQNFF